MHIKMVNFAINHLERYKYVTSELCVDIFSRYEKVIFINFLKLLGAKQCELTWA